MLIPITANCIVSFTYKSKLFGLANVDPTSALPWAICRQDKISQSEQLRVHSRLRNDCLKTVNIDLLLSSTYFKLRTTVRKKIPSLHACLWLLSLYHSPVILQQDMTKDYLDLV